MLTVFIATDIRYLAAPPKKLPQPIISVVFRISGVMGMGVLFDHAFVHVVSHKVDTKMAKIRFISKSRQAFVTLSDNDSECESWTSVNQKVRLLQDIHPLSSGTLQIRKSTWS